MRSLSRCSTHRPSTGVPSESPGKSVTSEDDTTLNFLALGRYYQVSRRSEPNPVGSAPGRKRKCVTCALRFSRLLARFVPRCRSLALLGWIPSAVALDQTPDRAIR